MLFSGNCLFCGKYFERTYSPSCQPIPKFCSKSCSNSINKIGNKNTEQPKVKINCLFCGKEIYVTKKQSKRKKYCSRSCQGKHQVYQKSPNHKKTNVKSKRVCIYCGKEFEVYNCQLNRKTRNNGQFCSHSCTRRYHNQLYVQSKPPTSIELAIQNKLDDLKIPHTTQLRQYIYLIDIALENQKIAIECDGDYWHSLPGRKESDKRKDKYLKSKGWKVIRFSETNINNNLSWCLSILLHELNITTDT